jgi:hypothetical protein
MPTDPLADLKAYRAQQRAEARTTSEELAKVTQVAAPATSTSVSTPAGDELAALKAYRAQQRTELGAVQGGQKPKGQITERKRPLGRNWYMFGAALKDIATPGMRAAPTNIVAEAAKLAQTPEEFQAYARAPAAMGAGAAAGTLAAAGLGSLFPPAAPVLRNLPLLAAKGAAEWGSMAGVERGVEGLIQGEQPKEALVQGIEAALPAAGLGAGLGVAGVPVRKLWNAIKWQPTLEDLSKIRPEALRQRALVKAVHAEMTTHHPTLAGAAGREARLARWSQAFGRPIASTTELTEPELMQSLNALRLERLNPTTGAVLPGTELTPAQFEKMLYGGGKLSVQKQLATLLKNDPTPSATTVQTAWRWIFSSGEAALQKMGRSGTALAQLLELAGRRGMAQGAPAFYRLDKMLAKFDRGMMDEFVNVVEGADLTENLQIGEAVAEWRAEAQRIAEAANEVGLRTWSPATKTWTAFQPRDFYYPRHYTEASLNELSESMRKDVLGKVMKANLDIVTEEQARQWLLRSQWLDRAPELLNANLQRARLTDLPGYDRNARRVLLNYVMQAWNRIEAARMLGPGHELGDQLVTMIGMRHGRSAEKLALNILDTSVGYRPWEGQSTYRKMRAWASMSALSPTSAGKHMSSQFSTTIADAGVRRTVAAAFQLATNPEAMQIAKDLGPLTRDIIPEIMEQETSRLSHRWTSAIGLRFMMQQNRLISGLARLKQIEQLAANYAAKPTPKLTRELGRIGLNPEEIIASGGKLSDLDKRVAALYAINRGELMSRALDLPAIRNTTVGQFIWFLRASAFQQTRAVKNVAIKPFSEWVASNGARGTPAPLMRYLTASGLLGTPTGLAILKLRQIFRGSRPEEEKPGLVKIIMAQATAGQFGIIDELCRAIAGGPDTMEEFVLGYYGATGFELGGAAVQSVKQRSVTPFARTMVRRGVPFVSPMLRGPIERAQGVSP